MPEVIVLRTHFYDAFVDRMVRGLQAGANRRVVAVTDERAGPVSIPGDITKIPLDPAARGLFTMPEQGWRCGDYALYEAVRAVPEASAYWMIEPDVRIHAGDVAAFFDGAAATHDADLVTAWFARAAAGWQWYRHMAPFAANIHTVMMQLCRVSRPAALHLLRERRSLGERFLIEGRPSEDWPNDEAFVGTTLFNAGYRMATFREHAPGFRTDGSFTFIRPTSERWLAAQPFDNRIYHPVVRGEKFRERLKLYLAEGRPEAGADAEPIDPLLQKQLDIESAPETAPTPIRATQAIGVPPAAPLPPATLIPAHGMAAPDAPAGRPIPIRFWNRIRNNGDAITAILISSLFGGKPYQARPADPHMLGVGSVLFMANRHSLVWGSGVLNRTAYLPPIDGRQVRALRGKLSAQHLMEHGIALGEIAFGDPGILVDQLLPQALKAARARYRVAVIPHHDSMSLPFFTGLHGRDDICLVNILDDGMLPVQQIAQSEIVLSQSLHGLVYAESLNKPSLWIGTRSDAVWNYKFDDWFTTTANPQAAPAPLEQGLERLAEQAELRHSTIDRAALIESFPAELFQDADTGKLPYAICRAQAPVTFFIQAAYEEQPDFVPGRDGPLLASLSPMLASITSALFAGWAERTYSIAAMIGAAALPTPDQSRAIIAALDARSTVDFGILIRKPAVPPEGARAIDLPHGVTLYANYKALGAVLYLRPSFESLSENFVVFAL